MNWLITLLALGINVNINNSFIDSYYLLNINQSIHLYVVTLFMLFPHRLVNSKFLLLSFTEYKVNYLNIFFNWA